MVTDLRNNLDVIVVVVAALIIYHFYKKMTGRSKGMSK